MKAAQLFPVRGTARKCRRPAFLSADEAPVDAADDDENNADFIEDIHGNTSFLRLV